MSVATSLREFLTSSQEKELAFTFAQIEAIAGAPLPESARRYPAYWSAGNALGRLLSEAGWRATPRLSAQVVLFSRISGTPIMPSAINALPDLVLIGCVKTKRRGRHAARELYRSTLFRGRMARAIATGVPWFIMSAKYGLLHPDDVVDSYDETLIEMTSEQRRLWSENLLQRIAEHFGEVNGKTIEIHAGDEYRSSGLVAGLKAAGASISVPLKGLGLGEQLAWYGPYTAAGAPAAQARSAPSPGPASRARIDGLRVRRLASLITRDFQSGSFDLSQRRDAPTPGWSALPEFVAASALRERGAGSAEIRRFCTFVAAMDRARDADRLWQRGVELHREVPWVFDPEQVAAAPLRSLRETLARAGVSQRHGVDSASWRLIAEALVADDGPKSVKVALDDGIGDASNLLQSVRAVTDAGQPCYSLLSGPKVSVMWVRMLAAPGGADIDRLGLLPVAVDVQVRKVTEYLGVTDTAGRNLEDVRDVIQDAWSGAASEAVGPGALAGTAAALDPAIWFMGKWGCTFCERMRARIPIGSACAECHYPDQSGRGSSGV